MRKTSIATVCILAAIFAVWMIASKEKGPPIPGESQSTELIALKERAREAMLRKPSKSRSAVMALGHFAPREALEMIRDELRRLHGVEMDGKPELISDHLDTLSLIVEGWTLEDPDAVKTWLLAMEEQCAGPGGVGLNGLVGDYGRGGANDGFIHSIRRGLVSGLAQGDPAQAISLAKDLQVVDPDAPGCSLLDIRGDKGLDLLHYSADRLVERGRFEEAHTFIEEMPAGSNSGAYWYSLSLHWGEHDPIGMEEFLQNHPEAFPGKDRSDLQENMYRGYIKTNPEWVMRQQGGLYLFPEWLRSNSPQAALWLQSQPVSETFDGARIATVRHMTNQFYGQSHFQQRMDLLNRIADQGDSDLAFDRRNLVEEWQKHDLSGFENWDRTNTP